MPAMIAARIVGDHGDGDEPEPVQDPEPAGGE
jgi:hypothetical protein